MRALTSFVQARLPSLYKWITLRLTRVRYDSAPFTPLRKPLSQCRFALVTSGGFHTVEQTPFADKRIDECSFREIPTDTPVENLRITHEHYDHAAVEKDLNILLPRDRFRELEGQGVIGSLAPVMISFMGAILQPKTLIRETGPAAAARLKQLDVDCVLLTPA